MKIICGNYGKCSLTGIGCFPFFSLKRELLTGTKHAHIRLTVGCYAFHFKNSDVFDQ